MTNEKNSHQRLGHLTQVTLRVRGFLRAVFYAVKRLTDKFYDFDSASQQMQKLLLLNYTLAKMNGQKPYENIADAGFRCYSQLEEDGIILYVLAMIGFGNKQLVEMCCGNGSECMAANLIINQGFQGYLFDGNEQNVKMAEKFFSHKKDCVLSVPKISNAWITAENVNDLLRQAGVSGEVDLFSLDIDGNDYWIWKALEVISPRLCVFETHNIIPSDLKLTIEYQADFNSWAQSGCEQDYRGASLAAFVALGKEKGYRLIGGHRHGFNAFFLRNDIAPDLFPEVSVESVHNNLATQKAQKERWPLVKNMNWVTVG